MDENGRRWERAAGIACALRTWSATIRTLLRSSAAVDHTTDGTSDGKAWSKDSQEGKLSKSRIAAGERRADDGEDGVCLAWFLCHTLTLQHFRFWIRGTTGEEARKGKGRTARLRAWPAVFCLPCLTPFARHADSSVHLPLPELLIILLFRRVMKIQTSTTTTTTATVSPGVMTTRPSSTTHHY